MSLVTLKVLYAQQDAQFTQYMYNTQSVNPAYAGTSDKFVFTALHRSQWFGIDGAPTTTTVSGHSPVGYNGLGFGFSFINDKIGPTSETSFDFDASYSLYFGRERYLAFGLKLSGHFLDIRFSELTPYDTGDLIIQKNIDNEFSPNLGAGLYFFGPKFYVGVSAPRFWETAYFNKSNLILAKERMHFYLIGGYIYEPNAFLKIKPAILTKAVKGAPLQLDMSLNFLFNEKFVVGAAYRWDAAISAMAGFYIGDGLFLGLAYDREVSALGNTQFNDGSLEVILEFGFKNRTCGCFKSPRFF